MKDSLKDRLKDWVDFDGALYSLGCVLGFYQTKDGEDMSFSTVKAELWSCCDNSNALGVVMKALVEAGFLEYDNEESKYRWIKEPHPEA